MTFTIKKYEITVVPAEFTAKAISCGVAGKDVEAKDLDDAIEAALRHAYMCSYGKGTHMEFSSIQEFYKVWDKIVLYADIGGVFTGASRDKYVPDCIIKTVEVPVTFG